MFSYWRVTARVVILGAILNVTYSRIYSCAPGNNQNIKCEYSSNSAADCSDGESVTTTTSPVAPVEYLDVYQFMGSRLSGVVITWRPPNSFTLNRTAGYLLSIYYTATDGRRTRWKCRYFKIYSVQPSVQVYEASRNFSYLEPKLPFDNSRLKVELLTLPFDPDDRQYSAKTVSFNVFGNPAVKFDTNGTADNNSYPYTVVSKFRRSSYSHRTDVLYNHTFYRLYLLKPGRGLVYDIYGKRLDPLDISTSKEEEYAEATFSVIPPGLYDVEVWPSKLKDGRNTTDTKQITHWSATVVGSDYMPESPPKIILSANKKLVVSFMAAPSRLFFESYQVVVYDPNVGLPASNELNTSTLNPLASRRSIAVNVTAKRFDEWYEHNVTFATVEVVSLFDEKIRHLMAKVIPTVNPNLCSKSGHCNLNGSCTPCTESVSAAFNLVKVEEEVPVMAIAIPTASVVLLALIVLVAVWCKRRNPPSDLRFDEVSPVNEPLDNNFDDRLTHYSGANFDAASEMFMSVQPIKACIAFVAEQFSKAQYEKVYHGLSEMCQKFFGFSSMTLFSEVCAGHSREMHNFDFILIFCTPELYVLYKQLKAGKCPERMSRAEMYQWKIRELLLGPQNRVKPVKIMINLGVLTSEQMKELAGEDPNSCAGIYDLPEQLKQLVTAMHCGGKLTVDSRELTSWPPYIEGGKHMNDKLCRDIKQLVSIYKQYEEIKKTYDSGIVDDSLTVTTDMQISRMETQSVKDQQPTVSTHSEKLQNDALPSNDAGEKIITLTQPQADEMAYLRQNSSDIPSHLRHNVPVQLHTAPDAPSVYSVASSNGDITSTQHGTDDSCDRPAWQQANEPLNGAAFVGIKEPPEKMRLIAHSGTDSGNQMSNGVQSKTTINV